jgi:hypothetical protein
MPSFPDFVPSLLTFRCGISSVETGVTFASAWRIYVRDFGQLVSSHLPCCRALDSLRGLANIVIMSVNLRMGRFHPCDAGMCYP